MDYTNDKKTSDTEYQRDGAVEGGNVNTFRDDRREYSRGGRGRRGGAHQSDNWRSFPASGDGEGGDYRGGRGGGFRGGRGGGRGARGFQDSWADRETNRGDRPATEVAKDPVPAAGGNAESAAQQQQPPSESREMNTDRWGHEDDRGYSRGGGGGFRGGNRGGFSSRGGRGSRRYYDAEEEGDVGGNYYNARRGDDDGGDAGGEEGGFGGGFRRGGRGGGFSPRGGRGGRGGRRFYDDEGGYGNDAAEGEEEGERGYNNEGGYQGSGFRRGGRGGGRGGGRDFDYDRPRGRGGRGGRGGGFRNFRDGDDGAEESGATQENAWTASPEPASTTPAAEERPVIPREVPAPAVVAPQTAASIVASRPAQEPQQQRAEAPGDWEEAAAPGPAPPHATIQRVVRAPHLRKNCHDEAKVEELFTHHHRQAGISLENYDSIPVEMVPRDIKPVEDFVDLLVEPALAQNIERCGYKRPTPVQRYGIPVALSGSDLMACAQTGSGKTAAFLIPVVQHILVYGVSPARNRKSYPIALVLAPTRELAVQIFDEVRKLTFNTDIFYDVVYGGTRYPNRFEQDILVACPGRLRDMFNEEYLSFSAIKFLILDEADRMLEMGFEEQIEELVASRYTDMPTVDDRQTFMFSATFPQRILNLAKRYLRRKYYLLTVGRVGSTTKNITQTIENVPDNEKMDRLLQIIYGHEMSDMVLIFVETKKMAEEVNRRLHREGIQSATIHGDRRQQDREAALEDFKQKVTPILVATDVASRGLDIPDVAHVVQFDLPQEMDDYTHRIGRTGRAGNKGLATAFYNRNNRRLALEMHKYFTEHGQEIPKWFQQEAELVEGEALLSRDSGGGRRRGGGGGGGGHRGGGGDRGGGRGGGGGTWGQGRPAAPSAATRRGGNFDDGGF
ncbi:putative ATP-dependent RNA helicase [Leptomonas pyrrhocoris]|uniref:Probable eukaryotic initiation factor 4A n=1 Tax=Leptomonas pyrrhocoris TaxID=157538 RepID=A0A0M9GAT9_LEPPY|nr:putative ATP-dependent RNA helicase [Leptomonas pyrrhocoris]KPA86339.1 putative ATP-dependent RNA helicase [Leptomonas pyrrhocoris]|eukprot:XP_015664778.1 putative ATP-dependent RNA helicase [Leptomonas pyrrhocoris]